MPKKKGTSRSKIIVGIIVILIVGIAVVGWHDGLMGVTPIENINNFSVDNGTAVTVKGEITLIFGDLVTIQDATGSIGFTWADSGSLIVHSIVVVRGVVSSFLTLSDVSSVAPVWLIA